MLIIIKRDNGESIILGLDAERVLANALVCYIDHRATDKNEYQARMLLEQLGVPYPGN